MCKLDVRKSLDMCRFNNPLVTLPSFTTTGRSSLRQLELPRCSAKLQSTIFSTLLIALCEVEPPKSVDFDFSCFLSGEHVSTAPQRKVLFCKAPLVRLPQKHQRKRNPYSCKVEDISDAKSSISAEMFTPGRDNNLHFS